MFGLPARKYFISISGYPLERVSPQVEFKGVAKELITVRTNGIDKSKTLGFKAAKTLRNDMVFGESCFFFGILAVNTGMIIRHIGILPLKHIVVTGVLSGKDKFPGAINHGA
jgi:hypothetical protein